MHVPGHLQNGGANTQKHDLTALDHRGGKLSDGLDLCPLCGAGVGLCAPAGQQRVLLHQNGSAVNAAYQILILQNIQIPPGCQIRDAKLRGNI